MKVYNKQSEQPICDEIQNLVKQLRAEKKFDASDYVNKKSKLLNDYMTKFNLKACVVAISGGIDSAAVLALVNHASKLKGSPIEKIVPLLLPISKSIGVTNQDKATARGKELCQSLNLTPYVIDLSKVNKLIRRQLESAVGIKGEAWAIGQLGPYSRTPILYYTTSLLCQEGKNAIICGTTNRDEGTYLGYIGKASDGMVDLQIISDLHKSEVYDVSKLLNVPQSIIDVTPSGDMYDNRSDEMVFGAPYDFVEYYLNFLRFDNKRKEIILNSLSEKAKAQFKLYADNLENLHKYNLHKYMSNSPAIHLDLWDCSIDGGWENFNRKINKIMEE